MTTVHPHQPRRAQYPAPRLHGFPCGPGARRSRLNQRAAVAQAKTNQGREQMNAAQKISAALGDDGQVWTDKDGQYLTELAAAAGATTTWRDGYRTGDIYRLNFPDGSAIVVMGDCWDYALHQGERECFCPDAGDSDREHDAHCPLAT